MSIETKTRLGILCLILALFCWGGIMSWRRDTGAESDAKPRVSEIEKQNQELRRQLVLEHENEELLEFMTYYAAYESARKVKRLANLAEQQEASGDTVHLNRLNRLLETAVDESVEVLKAYRDQRVRRYGILFFGEDGPGTAVEEAFKIDRVKPLAERKIEEKGVTWPELNF